MPYHDYDADFLVAHEPPSNDQNRLKSLVGEAEYDTHIAPKVVCFKRGVVDRIFTSNKTKDDQFVYFRGKAQPGVYLN